MRDFSFDTLCITIVIMTFIISLFGCVIVASTTQAELKSKCLERATVLECNILN